MRFEFGSVVSFLVLLLAACMPSALADLAVEVASLEAGEVAAFEATLAAPADPMPLPVLAALPGVEESEAELTPDAPEVANGTEVEVEVSNDPGIAAPVPFAPEAPPPVDEPLMLEVTAGTTPFECELLAEDEEAVVKCIILYWHTVALEMHRRDYSLLRGSRVEPSHPGPCYTSRVLAMVHIAMYDAVTGITREDATYQDYPSQGLSLPVFTEEERLPATAAAIGWAAFRTLFVLYDEDQGELNTVIRNYRSLLLAIFANRPVLFRGQRWGADVARIVNRARVSGAGGDGSNAGPAFTDFVPPPSPVPYAHRPDPTAMDDASNGTQPLYAAHWGGVTPFGHSSAATLPDNILEVVDPATATLLVPDLFQQDFREVKDLGNSDLSVTTRTQEQTNIGIFWAYDGAFMLGVPPRLYAQNVDVMVAEYLDEPVLATGFQLARLYAMTHIAMADSTIAAWRDKYKFNFWRPIIGIRDAAPPLGDPLWIQFGSPKTNFLTADQPGTNPAFPAYPSGHATIGTAAFEVARQALNIPANQAFEMVSDEFNGENTDSQSGQPRPSMVRSLTVDAAIKENQDSRVFLGVHWNFDSTEGGVLGEAIASNIVANFPGRA